MVYIVRMRAFRVLYVPFFGRFDFVLGQRTFCFQFIHRRFDAIDVSVYFGQFLPVGQYVVEMLRVDMIFFLDVFDVPYAQTAVFRTRN